MRNYYKHPLNFILNIKEIITIEYMTLQKDFFLPLENHNFYEFVYVDNGTATYDIDGVKYTIKSGEVFILEPNKNHFIVGDGENETDLFIICFECSSPFINQLNRFSRKLITTEKQTVKKILTESQNTYSLPLYNKKEFVNNPLFGGEQTIGLYFELLLITFIRSKLKNNKTIINTESQNTENSLFLMIKDYLEKSVYTKINVRKICDNFYYSKTYISTLFKEQSGETIIEYFNKLKIKEAKKMLLETNYTSAQISDFLSFSDPRYFLYQFKKLTGMTPSQYRKLINSAL